MRLPEFAKRGLGAITAGGAIALTVTAAHAFPWSTDMYRGPQVSTFVEPPRAMPDGVLPIDGTHYNTHYGQPAGMPSEPALPPLKLEVMTLKMHNPLSPTPANLAQGKERFDTNCAPCHGATGQGNGPVAHLLRHPPANLLFGVIRAFPDGYVYGYIRNGGVWMPAYDDAMSSSERWQTVLYLRDLQRRHRETGPVTLRLRGPIMRRRVKPEELGPHRNATDAETNYTEQGSDSP